MIKHIKCNIFESGADVICHQVNCQGVMGSGIARQVREKFPNVYNNYVKNCNYFHEDTSKLLGCIQVDSINEKQKIVNLYAQNTFGYDGKRYTDYSALKNCLCGVCNHFIDSNYTIAFPYLMSCDRGGGSWDIVYEMIEEIFKDYDGDILICEYKENN